LHCLEELSKPATPTLESKKFSVPASPQDQQKVETNHVDAAPKVEPAKVISAVPVSI
jgi:hypothetical protein